MKIRQRRLLVLVLSLALVIGLLPFAVAADEEPEVKQVVVLHTNDIHGRAVGDQTPGKDGLPVSSGIIGYARYKTIIETLREVNEGRVLVFDAGDVTHGTNFATLSHGQSMVRLMNDLGVDAMTLGNHEFNYGQEDLDVLTKEADFPMLAANILSEEDGETAFGDRVVFEVDGLKVGVFGMATPETKVKSSPLNTVGLEFADPALIAEQEVAALQEEEVDVIIMLAHLGIDDESEFSTYYVLDQVEGIDVVIDGHSHHHLPEGEEYNDTLLVQTGSHLANVGVLTLTFTDGELTDKTGRTIDFLEAQQYLPDADIEASIAAVEEENKRFTEEEVAPLGVKLDGEREDVRTRETNLANLVSDAILWATEADAVISNGGNIRISIEPGMITMGDLLTCMPFENMITVIEVTGKDIKDALIFGADAYPGTAGKFPHVAALTYEIHKVGEDEYEVQNILLNGEELDDDAVYHLATNDFLAVGGDGYTMFEGKEQVLLHGLMVDIVHDYIVELTKDGEPLVYEEDGRIKVVED